MLFDPFETTRPQWRNTVSMVVAADVDLRAKEGPEDPVFDGSRRPGTQCDERRPHFGRPAPSESARRSFPRRLATSKTGPVVVLEDAALRPNAGPDDPALDGSRRPGTWGDGPRPRLGHFRPLAAA